MEREGYRDRIEREREGEIKRKRKLERAFVCSVS